MRFLLSDSIDEEQNTQKTEQISTCLTSNHFWQILNHSLKLHFGTFHSINRIKYKYSFNCGCFNGEKNHTSLLLCFDFRYPNISYEYILSPSKCFTLITHFISIPILELRVVADIDYQSDTTRKACKKTPSS